jgi:hypothetical protein
MSARELSVFVTPSGLARRFADALFALADA